MFCFGPPKCLCRRAHYIRILDYISKTTAEMRATRGNEDPDENGSYGREAEFGAHVTRAVSSGPNGIPVPVIVGADYT